MDKKSLPQPWVQAFQFINEDGADLAHENGDIGFCRYAGQRPLDVPPGKEVTITAWVPRPVLSRCITALVDSDPSQKLTFG